MVSQLEVETVEGRDIRPPMRWTWPAAFAAVLSLAGVVALFGSASGAKPSLKGGAGVAASAQSSWSPPTRGDIHDIYKDHQRTIDKANETWKEHDRDPCILVRYGCMQMDNQTYCEMAGDYCRWVDVPGYRGCLKEQHGVQDICAALRKQDCIGAKKYCTWQDVDIDGFRRDGYCLESKESDRGCDMNVLKGTCKQREDCEWKPARRLQAGVPGLPGNPGQLPGAPQGKCLKRTKKTKDDCCTQLGPDEKTCGKVQKVCKWDQQADVGKGKCKSSGVEHDVDDDRKREQEEICHNIGSEVPCLKWDLICKWTPESEPNFAGGHCEPREKAPDT